MNMSSRITPLVMGLWHAYRKNLGNVIAFISIRVLEGDYNVQTLDGYIREINGIQTSQADGILADAPRPLAHS